MASALYEEPIDEVLVKRELERTESYVNEQKRGLLVFYRGTQDGQPVIWVTHEKEK